MSDLRYPPPEPEKPPVDAEPSTPVSDSIEPIAKIETIDTVESGDTTALETVEEKAAAPQHDDDPELRDAEAVLATLATSQPESSAILQVENLRVTARGKAKPAVDGVSFDIEKGETVVLFGEQSGGQDVLLRTIGGTLGKHQSKSGTLKLGGDGRPVRVSYLPGTFLRPLSPYATADAQLARVIMRKLGVPENAAREELRLALAKIDGAPSLAELHKRPGALPPHVLAYALLAAAIAQTPDLLLVEHFVADIPLLQARALIMALIALQKELGFAMLYSARGAHALNWLGGRVLILRQGRIVEEGKAARLASGAAHPYTQSLFRGLPRLSQDARQVPRGEPMLQVRGLEFDKSEKSQREIAREGLTFELRRGASLALVGEEGSGRRRLMRTLIGLERPAAGRLVMDAVDIGILSEPMLQRMRRRVAFIVGTDDVLDDRMSIWDTVAEPLRAHLSPSRDVVAGQSGGALKRVGLAQMPRSTKVAMLSAFDRRRLQIARAIVTQPHLAIVEEPLRGLDAFGQGVIRDLLKDFRRQEGSGFLIITTDFSVADALAEEAFVFQNGRVVERGALAQILKNPKESETKKLIDAVTAADLSRAIA